MNRKSSWFEAKHKANEPINNFWKRTEAEYVELSNYDVNDDLVAFIYVDNNDY